MLFDRVFFFRAMPYGYVIVDIYPSCFWKFINKPPVCASCGDVVWELCCHLTLRGAHAINPSGVSDVPIILESEEPFAGNIPVSKQCFHFLRLGLLFQANTISSLSDNIMWGRTAQVSFWQDIRYLGSPCSVSKAGSSAQKGHGFILMFVLVFMCWAIRSAWV